MRVEAPAYCKEMVFVRSARSFKPLRTSDIVWICAEGNYVHIHTNAERYTVRVPLGTLIELLGSPFLVRIHKSAGVNLLEVERMENWFSGEMLVVLKNGQKLRMSRKYRQELKLQLRFLV